MTPVADRIPVVLDGVSYRHGTWRDVAELVTAGLASPAQVESLTKGGLRRYSVIDEPVRRLYAECVSESLERAAVKATDVEAAILFSSTFSAYDDHADIIELCHTLGMRNAMPLGLFLGQCTNFSQALMVAAALIRGQGLRSVLLVGSDALDESRGDRVLDGNRSVFSDTVVSCVVGGELSAGYALEHVDHATEPELCALDPQRNFLKIVDLFAKMLEGLCARTYATCGHGPADFSALVLANLTVPVLKNYAMAAGMKFARVPTANIGRFGHCFAYDQLITLGTLADEGNVHSGDLLHLLGVGANYLFSSTVVRRL
jgi:3-oxoacyl-[acyl-carrier-protein] synthase-3